MKIIILSSILTVGILTGVSVIAIPLGLLLMQFLFLLGIVVGGRSFMYVSFIGFVIATISTVLFAVS